MNGQANLPVSLSFRLRSVVDNNNNEADLSQSWVYFGPRRMASVFRLIRVPST